MYPDYVSSVVEEYHRLRDCNSISHRLADPTPARLRDECLDVFQSRFLKKDEPNLRVFFRHTKEIDTLGQSIETHGLGKFKALHNFLINKTDSTDQKNIELLAWLIDFEPRPYEFGRKYPRLNENQKESRSNKKIGEEGIIENGSGSKEIPEVLKSIKVPTSSTSTSNARSIIITLIITLIVGYSAFSIWGDKKAIRNSSGFETCMYWAGDQYKTGNCIQRGGDSVLAAYDANKMRNFRRIMDTSKITEKAIGNVWYRITKGKYEFYTMDEKHPVDGKRLTRLTYKGYLKYRASLKKGNE